MRFVRHADTFIVRLDPDVDIAAAIPAFAAEQDIEAGTVEGIGAGYHWVLGYFDRATRTYGRRTFAGEWELLSLSGTLATKEGCPIAHVHVVLGGPDFRTVGGHLFEGHVGATVELVIRRLPIRLGRVVDEATGLFLLDL